MRVLWGLTGRRRSDDGVCDGGVFVCVGSSVGPQLHTDRNDRGDENIPLRRGLDAQRFDMFANDHLNTESNRERPLLVQQRPPVRME